MKIVQTVVIRSATAGASIRQVDRLRGNTEDRKVGEFYVPRRREAVANNGFRIRALCSRLASASSDKNDK
jgi:hypothetical protein